MELEMKRDVLRRPFSVKQKLRAIEIYNATGSINRVIRIINCSKATLYRWIVEYDGSEDSIRNRSHKPKTNKNQLTEREISEILRMSRLYDTVGVIELYTIMKKEKAYTRSISTLYRYLKKLKIIKHLEVATSKYVPKVYDTPKEIGIKMQMDVKFVPTDCHPNKNKRYYQYTIMDEASRERFIYAYDEHNSKSTIDFMKRAFIYFGYKPVIIQTDNGQEFTYPNKDKAKGKHPLDVFLEQENVKHQLIRPRTPRHNGKVERSHRNDNNRFYRKIRFNTLDDLQKKMKDYLEQSNNTMISTLKYLTPIEKRKQLEEK